MLMRILKKINDLNCSNKSIFHFKEMITQFEDENKKSKKSF